MLGLFLIQLQTFFLNVRFVEILSEFSKNSLISSISVVVVRLLLELRFLCAIAASIERPRRPRFGLPALTHMSYIILRRVLYDMTMHTSWDMDPDKMASH